MHLFEENAVRGREQITGRLLEPVLYCFQLVRRLHTNTNGAKGKGVCKEQQHTRKTAQENSIVSSGKQEKARRWLRNDQKPENQINKKTADAETIIMGRDQTTAAN